MATLISRYFLTWYLIGLAFVGASYFVPYPLLKDHLKEFIALKLALIGLLAALSTFQWGWWQEYAQRRFQELYEPQWTALWRLVAATPEDTDRRRQVARWLRWRRSAARSILKGVFPNTARGLATIASAIYLFLVSVLSDIVALLDGVNQAAQVISLGTFAGGLLAGMALWGLHIYGLDAEHADWERGFRQATRRRQSE